MFADWLVNLLVGWFVCLSVTVVFSYYSSTIASVGLKFGVQVIHEASVDVKVNARVLRPRDSTCSNASGQCFSSNLSSIASIELNINTRIIATSDSRLVLP